MKMTFVSQVPKPETSKTASLSCKNCSRLIEIEGEMLCYRGGKITELTPVNEAKNSFNLLCDGWQADRNQTKK
ncbi:MAG: hypothetical protein WBO22_03500 [Shewanella indica]|uniref:DUF1496 domain-containing protein n=2 Tax=Shewanellaceae TaxID=267890 RepID=A0ABX5PRZ8_9GAMM|nr:MULTISPECIES: hypothetical protein [Shewanella]MBZ4678871.1 hypothetical protein [Shewanella sp.]MCA0951477.1 hypothetical protein [Shewanella chilikensis]MCE9853295.1 hypothetical protein [Shewanella chilikensis]MCL1153251.1 hypothetical protein [Shewanella chilikensis]MCL1163996.1 hypothetical protein [Shewanella chilikensis]